MQREVVPGQFYFLGPKLQQCLNIKRKLAVVYLLKMLYAMEISIRIAKMATFFEGVIIRSWRMQNFEVGRVIIVSENQRLKYTQNWKLILS